MGDWEPDLFTGLNNYWRGNRTLEIEVEQESGHRTILDFRNATKTLAFNFVAKRDVNGNVERDAHGNVKVSLEIEREEQWNYPYAKIPLDLPIWRFNNIEITNIDENTIIYTGRKENLVRIGKDVELRATIIGGGGLAPLTTLASVGEIFESTISGRLWNVTATNLLDYTRFGLTRNTVSDLGGGTPHQL